MTTPDDDFTARLHVLLSHAVAALDPQDRAERIAWCRENDVHGIRMHLDGGDDVLDFMWGGRRLAQVRRLDLLSGEGLEADFVAEASDIVPPEWSGK